jgi:hypothetical protein
MTYGGDVNKTKSTICINKASGYTAFALKSKTQGCAFYDFLIPYGYGAAYARRKYGARQEGGTLLRVPFHIKRITNKRAGGALAFDLTCKK